MGERPNDLRVVKTIDAIHETFGQMICEMDYGKITVKELCARARINKKTFYRYYETLDFLLAEFQERMMADYLPRVQGYGFPDDLGRHIRAFFEFAEERGAVFEHVTLARNYEFARDAMIDGVMGNFLDEGTAAGLKAGRGEGSGETGTLVDSLAAERAIMVAFQMNATIEIYRQWVAGGKVIPLERIIQIATELEMRGIEGFNKIVK